MHFKIGDYVTRKSYQNDILFIIIDIIDNTALLKGIDVRLLADSELNDLEKSEVLEDMKKEDATILSRLKEENRLDRSEYFYLPGKVLHIDGDFEYLNRCMNFYRSMNINAYGVKIKEEEVADRLPMMLENVKPDIVVITGHDSRQKRNGKYVYKNSDNFISAVKSARNYEKNQDKLMIIAGACQSNYEELIKAGANFASSPKRINIHALDPAIIASSVSLSKRNQPIDLLDILEKTRYGKDGMGGLMCNGIMYVGYPR